jgi:hypothetical protein
LFDFQLPKTNGIAREDIPAEAVVLNLTVSWFYLNEAV